jgi:GDP-mannose 6-dehydrogenase
MWPGYSRRGAGRSFQRMRISVFGLGYVGSITASCLAKAGHDIIGVDTNAEKVAMINGGVPPLMEPGLESLLKEVVASGKLRATTTAGDATRDTDMCLISVGTPSSKNGQVDIKALKAVGDMIGLALQGRKKPYTVIVRSTVLPGTTESVVVPAILGGAGTAFRPYLRVVFNPEFMREGTSLDDFARPPFTIVGCEEEETANLMKELYSVVEAPFIQTSIRTAEMVKYVSNAYHALKVCFANEVADICSALGADPFEVMRTFALDRKLNISDAYLRPGFAFGGSCLPKDVRALVYSAHSNDVSVPLLSSILPSNQGQIKNAVEAILATRKRKIGVVGLSFKKDTDDLRESPMVTLVETLIGKGCDIRVLDRNVSISRLMGANRRYIETEIPHIASLMCDTAEQLQKHAEIIIIGNKSDESKEVLASVQPDQILFDLTKRSVTPALPVETPVG